jgi:hypothetical protein
MDLKEQDMTIWSDFIQIRIETTVMNFQVL